MGHNIPDVYTPNTALASTFIHSSLQTLKYLRNKTHSSSLRTADNHKMALVLHCQLYGDQEFLERFSCGSFVCCSYTCTVLFFRYTKAKLKAQFHELNDAHVPSATSVKRNLMFKKKHKMQDFVTSPATDQNCCVLFVLVLQKQILIPVKVLLGSSMKTMRFAG